MNSSNCLSNKAYWEVVLRSTPLPRINSSDEYHYFATMQYMDRVLRRTSKRTFMEVGAGSSGWLPYFAKQYGYIVNGLDYSEIGCRIAEENLRILGIEYDEILCTDLFEWSGLKRYDVIFSYGVVEHFNDTTGVISRITRHLNIDGIIITLVPNLNGFMGWMCRTLFPDVYELHKVLSRRKLDEAHRQAGLTVIQSGYVGFFSLAVFPWIRSHFWLFKEGTLRRRICLKGVAILEKAFSKVFRALRCISGTSWFAPYVITIGRYETAIRD